MFNFTPTQNGDAAKIEVPFFEDARARTAPYYRSGSSIEAAQSAVVDELIKLGARGARFTEGYFGDKPKRYGYLIEFNYNGAGGVIQVAGLPTSGRLTESKLHQIRVQALLNVRDWLKAAVTAQVFAPGSYPLMQYLLVDGSRTLAQYMNEEYKLPESNPMLLPSGN